MITKIKNAIEDVKYKVKYVSQNWEQKDEGVQSLRKEEKKKKRCLIATTSS